MCQLFLNKVKKRKASKKKKENAYLKHKAECDKYHHKQINKQAS